MKKIIMLFVFLMIFTGCQKEESIYDIEDGFYYPSIIVNGNHYGVHPSKRNQKELDDTFTYYGTVKSAVDNKYEGPSEELQVSKVLDHCIGYKVYISDDRDVVAIFIESLNEYTFFD